MGLTSRERVKMALNHQQPDKVPIDFGGCETTVEAEAYEDFKKYLVLGEKRPFWLQW